MSSQDSNYKKALSEAVPVDNAETGFTSTKLLTAGDLSRKAIQQNNLIIQLIINLHQKVDSLKAEFTALKNKEASSSKAPPLPEDLIKQLEGLTIGSKPKPSEKKGTFFAFKDPYVTLEEEKAKLSK